MHTSKIIYSIGLIFFLCSCNSNSRFDFEKEFSDLGSQSLEESREEYSKCLKYLSEGRQEIKTLVKVKYVNNMGHLIEDEIESLNHKFLSDKCEYTYEEDNLYEMAILNQTTEYSVKKSYKYDKRNSKLEIFQKNNVEELTQKLEIKENKISLQGTLASPTEINIIEGNPYDALIAASGLADKLLSAEPRGPIRFTDETPFSEIEDVCNIMYFKASRNEINIKLTYNVLFDYDEEYGLAYFVPGSSGFKENEENIIPDGCKLGQITQEWKFVNKLVSYYHFYYTFQGTRDSKFLFKRIH